MLLEGGESRNFQGPGFFQVLEIFRSPGKIQVGMYIFPMIMPSASSSVEIGTFVMGPYYSSWNEGGGKGGVARAAQI